ncbi:hypothetical protein H6F61_11650 [Cyanobacteria bacterium FACHB-472]|nr:hypothetical protein [Cyanobacteria bacterium FACHB-472]
MKVGNKSVRSRFRFRLDASFDEFIESRSAMQALNPSKKSSWSMTPSKQAAIALTLASSSVVFVSQSAFNTKKENF